MEPDYAATLMDVLRDYPEAKVVGNAKTVSMIGQFFDGDISGRAVTVKEGDTLTTGRHTFTFLMAPMVHWPVQEALTKKDREYLSELENPEDTL